MLRRSHNEDGFTLIEVLVTLTLALVVFGATLAAFNVFQHDNVYARERDETQDAARNAIDRLTRQLRNVIAPNSKYVGALEEDPEEEKEYSIRFETVNTANETFTSENPTHAMRVRYCLDDSKPEDEFLREYVQTLTSTSEEKPSTTPCNGKLEGKWTSTRILVEHLTNLIHKEEPRQLFAYSSSEVPKVVTVTTDLYLDIRPSDKRPGESRLTSAVALRNANRQPIAKFTVASEAGNYRYRLNASESYDPDGLALTYKWEETKAGGTEQEISTSQIYETAALEPKKSYTFKLVVTNPGGLEATATDTITTPGTTS